MSKKNDFAENSIFLGVDFGTKRIGIATGQRITSTATPLTTLYAKNGVPNWFDLDEIVAKWRPVALIVGVPIDLDGSEHRTTKLARRFAAILRNRYQMPVYEVNEQLTTKTAKERVFSAGGYKALRQEKMDSIAAKLILEGWFSEK
ncbi:MAG: Holliday junction DNA helicase RuvA [Gammaproteobacteria bacterium GWE2_37_16]|nr:MAG: Holliday junction DNA helicase RuvA [Gammaproteobacteria bacterium GWE2_37_16]